MSVIVVASWSRMCGSLTGKKDANTASSTAIVSVDVGADGKVNFDAIVKQGTNRNKTVFTKLADMKVGGEQRKIGCSTLSWQKPDDLSTAPLSG
jgi:hypothetical protein